MQVPQFGTNVIGVHPGRTKTGGATVGLPSSARPLSLEDAEALARLPNVVAMTPSAFGNAEVHANGRVRRVSVYGVGPGMPVVFKGKVRSGQFLPDEESGNARAQVVLGPKLKNELFGSENALGTRVRIGGLQFRVIGIMESKGQFLGIDLDDTAFIPAARAKSVDHTVVGDAVEPGRKLGRHLVAAAGAHHRHPYLLKHFIRLLATAALVQQVTEQPCPMARIERLEGRPIAIAPSQHQRLVGARIIHVWSVNEGVGVTGSRQVALDLELR